MSKNKRPIRALFDNLSSLTPEQIMDSAPFKEMIKKHAPEAIELALSSNKLYATLFEINTSGNYIELHRRHWESALESCLQWYIDDEDFAQCAHIRELIKKTKQKNKKIVNVAKQQTNGGL